MVEQNRSYSYSSQSLYIGAELTVLRCIARKTMFGTTCQYDMPLPRLFIN